MVSPHDSPQDLSRALGLSANTIAEARLAGVRGVGPLSRKRLVEALGDVTTILDAPMESLCRVQGIGPVIAKAIQAAPTIEDAERMLAAAAKQEIFAISIDAEGYPASLREIYDPPAVLYQRGSLESTDQRAVAIVGTRRATRYGLRQAEVLATGLAQAGITVVSGLARGIDAAAHRACLAAGGRTLAVMAGGLMKIYPPEHARLADEVAERGALLAESPPPMPPMSGSFPQRNRIISGLSLGVVVIEAAERSGALITARHAAEQGRDAFAVPGPIDSPQSAGCHRLIQEGAKLVTSVDDILEELSDFSVTPPLSVLASREQRTLAFDQGTTGKPSTPVRASILPPTDEAERAIWEVVGTEPMAIDQIIDTTGLPVPRVLAAISVMETAGRLRRISGATVARG